MGDHGGGVEARILKLELRLAYLTGAAAVAAVAILGFMGWTSWKTVPDAVRDQIGADTLGNIEAAATKADAILNVSTIQSELAELRDASGLCGQPQEECVCKTDGGSDKAKIVVCLSRCPDGRVAGFKIENITATSGSVSCGPLPSRRP